jgi:CO/xanthine dehydrogenase FAD-binding subunit
MTERFAGPTTVEAALAILASDAAARPVAGGTDLVVSARQGRTPLPESIVAIDRIAGLDHHAVVDGALVMGSLTSHEWIADSAEVRSTWSALADASSIVGSPATRATGTIGGNLMNASPAADTTAPLVSLGANVMLRAMGRGSRIVPVGSLAVGPGRTSAAADELLTTVIVPPPPPGSGSAYIRLEYRRAMEIAVVGAAGLITLASDGSIAGAIIALTSVAPTIVRAPEAEAVLVGRPANAATFRLAAEAAAAAARPIDDVRASAEYRRAMLVVVVARTLAAAAARARGESIPIPASRWAPGQEV